MRLLQNRTPVQLLWIIATSNLLVAIGFGVLSVLPRRHYQDWRSLVILALGLIASFIAEQDLKEGLASERWPDTLLNGPRKLVAAFSVLAVLLIVAGFVSTITDARNLARAWCFLSPAMSFTRISGYLRPRAASSGDSLLKPVEPPKPLQSEHWGTPPRPFSN